MVEGTQRSPDRSTGASPATRFLEFCVWISLTQKAEPLAGRRRIVSSLSDASPARSNWDSEFNARLVVCLAGKRVTRRTSGFPERPL